MKPLLTPVEWATLPFVAVGLVGALASLFRGVVGALGSLFKR